MFGLKNTTSAKTMNDLYGDLPPASGDIQPGGSTLKLPIAALHKQSSAAPPSAPQTAQPAFEEGKPLAKPKLGASSLIFKPRQTAVPHVTHKPVKLVPSVNSSSSAPVVKVDQAVVGDEAEGDSAPSNGSNCNESFDVPDPYNPQRPNDYIAFCEERIESKRLAKLAEENQKRLEETERLRKEQERQRQEAAERGDFRSLLEGAEGPRGRGRGRGAANLPAWITQQMTAEQLNTPVSTTSEEEARFRDPVQEVQQQQVRKASALSRPSCVLLLLNVCSQAEAAADGEALAEEVRTECSKLGPVRACVVLPSADTSEEVRTFVHFEKQEAAVRGLRELGGRFFGGRQLSAAFFDEQAFLRILTDTQRRR